MDYQEFVQRATEAIPDDPDHRAPALVEATLGALIPWLPEHALHGLLEALPGAPSDLKARTQSKRAAKHKAVDQVQAYVVKRTGVASSRAVEAAQIVCGTMQRSLDPELCAELVRALPRDVGQWFSPAPRYAAPAPGSGHGHHLSDGKPGATHPMSEGTPGSARPLGTAQPENRQSHSVATENPHGDSKVSSARGLTQEREHESLAEGRER